MRIPRAAVKHQGDAEGLPPSHHQVFPAQALGLMANVVVLSLKVDKLQPAVAFTDAWRHTGGVLVTVKNSLRILA